MSSFSSFFLYLKNVMVYISECFPNGTITAWALKLESVPSLDPSKLVLHDPNCGPSFSNDRLAYFVFAANSCGTTRKVAGNCHKWPEIWRVLNDGFLWFRLPQFVKNMMLYENEISLPEDEELNQKMLGEEPEYE